MATQTTEAQPGAGRTATLVAGDVVALLVFAALGRRSHGEAAGIAAFGEVAWTAMPFIIGWLLAAPAAGAFDPARTRGVLPMLRATLVGWSVGLLLGAIVRAAMLGRFSPLSFYVVTFLVALLLLGVWRSGFALFAQRNRA